MTNVTDRLSHGSRQTKPPGKNGKIRGSALRPKAHPEANFDVDRGLPSHR